MTGEGDAYLNTMAAWTQDHSSRALSVWPLALWQLGGALGLLALLLLVMAITWLVRRPGARQWTVEVRAWAWAYPLYLLFVTGPGASNIRYGVLAFPLLWPFVERTKGTDRKAQLGFALVLAAVGLVAQWVWINDYVVVTTRIDGTYP